MFSCTHAHTHTHTKLRWNAVVYNLETSALREEQRLRVKSYVFWDVTSCSPFRVNRRFEGTCRLHPQSRRISQIREQHEGRKSTVCLLPDSCWFQDWCSSTLKMNATYCCETSVKFKLSAWYYIPYVHNRLCENLKEDWMKLDPDNDGSMMQQATSLYVKRIEVN
jgi:hypothetical protein